MLASFPARMVNQKRTDLGIPNRLSLISSRFRVLRATGSFGPLGARSPSSGNLSERPRVAMTGALAFTFHVERLELCPPWCSREIHPPTLR
jgi:hypothetical protein